MSNNIPPSALPMNKVCPCPYCKGPDSFTGLVRMHPFNDRYEIRRCFKCGKDSFLPVDYWPEKKRKTKDKVSA